MNPNLFSNAKFGDMFLTNENKQAIFLHYLIGQKFAELYVENYGQIVVYTKTGMDVFNGAIRYITKKIERRNQNETIR